MICGEGTAKKGLSPTKNNGEGFHQNSNHLHIRAMLITTTAISDNELIIYAIMTKAVEQSAGSVSRPS
jgi:hypothetical protein